MRGVDDGPDGLNDAAFDRALAAAPRPTDREPLIRQITGALYESGLPAVVARAEAVRLQAALDAAPDVEAVQAVLADHAKRFEAAYLEAVQRKIALAYERGLFTSAQARARRQASLEEAFRGMRADALSKGLPSDGAP